MSSEAKKPVVKLMKFAADLKPSDVAAHVPKITSLPDAATDFVTREFCRANSISSRHKSVPGRGYLFGGYRDVAGLLLPHVRGLSHGDARTVIRHPKTIHTVAVAALRSTGELATLVRSNYETGYLSLHDDGYITFSDATHPSLKGLGQSGRYCPYAGEPGAPGPVPVFINFARHASEVALIADEGDRSRWRRKVGSIAAPFIFRDPYYGVGSIYG